MSNGTCTTISTINRGINCPHCGCYIHPNTTHQCQTPYIPSISASGTTSSALSGMFEYPKIREITIQVGDIMLPINAKVEMPSNVELSELNKIIINDDDGKKYEFINMTRVAEIV